MRRVLYIFVENFYYLFLVLQEKLSQIKKLSIKPKILRVYHFVKKNWEDSSRY